MAKTAIAAEPISDQVTRRAPEIDPSRVKVNSAGFVFRSMFVRLPESFIADDLKESAPWKRVQANSHTALRRFDQVVIVAYDESWIAEAVVAHADTAGVVLGKPRLTSFPMRTEQLYRDDKYAVEFVGAGYRVRRFLDQSFVTPILATAGQAERELFNMYPKRPAA